MTFLPVVWREMSVLSRRRITYYSRAITAFVSVLVMVWLLLVSLTRLPFSELGRSIFLILSSLSFAYALLVGAQATSDCISEEKREGTLGLLFLTDLKAIPVLSTLTFADMPVLRQKSASMEVLTCSVKVCGAPAKVPLIIAELIKAGGIFTCCKPASISCAANNLCSSSVPVTRIKPDEICASTGTWP